jgi:hypothetical protein
MKTIEKERLKNVAEFLRSIETVIDDLIKDYCPIEIESYTLTGDDLIKTATLLEEMACDE